ncbi:MAG TPA: CehA/McbA family metallohydrolase, partial [Caldilineaceae bacterium]|nr:CehA/McbA family metallohydrolase [Caldilineaceae bacterium]
MIQQRFEATLTARDCKRHLPHRFQVPAGCAQGEISLRFSPHRVGNTTNMLCLTVFDAHGFRGAGHRGGNEHIVRIAGDAATPGYEPGPLPAGEWVAQIDTHMIMPGEPVHYSLEITLREGPLAATPQPTPKARPSTNQGAGWYRGDLHSHTVHSDASQTIDELLQAARDYGLDFIFLTDHNTVSGLAEVEAKGDASLLTAGGVELTTFWGHALVLGGREWVDWRIRPGSDAIAQIAQQSYPHDLLF